MANEDAEPLQQAGFAEGMTASHATAKRDAAERETAEHGAGESDTAKHGAAEHRAAEHWTRAALTRLAALRREAAAAYAAISAADAALESLAGQRAVGERGLRDALAGYQVVSRALAAHARAKPGPLAQLLTGFRAGREWLARHSDLNVALREATEPLAAAQREVSRVKHEFAAQVQARAEAVTALRRLTAECVAVLDEIGLAEIGPAGTERAETKPDGTRFAQISCGEGLEANIATATKPSQQAANPAECHTE